MLKQFNEQLAIYTKAIKKLEEVVRHLNNDELSDLVTQQKKKMINTEFHVVVIGQFKRGKSTLIIYFIGDNILPTGVVPITSIVTFIRFGKNAKATISFKNNKTANVHLEEIDQYISELNNPKNIKNVDKIDIYIPSEILRNGIVLIDTPGIGSIHQHNTDEAYRYLPHADAAIFLTSSDAPISELELKFLWRIKDYFQKIFFVQNKTDYLSEVERVESILFSTEVVSKCLGRNIKIYPVSAKLAIGGKESDDANLLESSGMNIFEEELGKFLVNEKGDYLIKSYHHKINKLIGDIQNNIDFQINMLTKPIKSLEYQLDEFKNKASEVTRLKKEALALVEMELEELINIVEKDLTRFRIQYAKLIEENLTKLYQQNKNMKFKDLYIYLNSELENMIKNVILDWDKEHKNKLKKDYEEIIKSFTNKLNHAIEFINNVTYEVFGVKKAEVLDDMEFVDKDTFYFKFGSTSQTFLTPKLKYFLFLLPSKFRDNIMISDLKCYCQ